MILKRFIIVIVLILFVITAGVIGYMTIENLNFLDSLYMSIITLSTVGYKEVTDLSTTGKWFTIAMIIGGISIITIAFGIFSSLILKGEVGYYLWRRQMDKKIKSLKDHIILCGLGDLGEEVARNLKETNQKFIVIESSQAEVDRVQRSIGEYTYLVDDSTEIGVLERANIDTAGSIITCLGSDSQNLFVVITAKEANPKIRIISEAIDRKVKEKLRRAGADYIISPSLIGGTRMASVATKPAVVSFLDVVTAGGEKDLHVESVTLSEKSKVAKITLAEAQIPTRTGLIVIAIKKRETGQFIYNPLSTTRLEPGDEIIVLGQPESISQLIEYIS
jgi:voltage-gated potassium channel